MVPVGTPAIAHPWANATPELFAPGILPPRKASRPHGHHEAPGDRRHDRRKPLLLSRFGWWHDISRGGLRGLCLEHLGAMASESIDVRYVAKLARLALTDDEVVQYGAQLGDLLGHVGALSRLDTASVAATAQVVESRNVAREDVVGPCLDRAVVLAGAPQAHGAFFRVPQIIASEE